MSDNESVQKVFEKILWYYKYHFQNWVPIICNSKSKRFAFLGGTGGPNNVSTRVILKLFIINNGNNLNILNEEYFLACCKSNEYFVEIIDSILINNKYVCFVLREEGMNLKDFIDFEENNYSRINPYYNRWIIFRIGCGLKILHEKGLSHNDIKPGNIVITGNGKAKICDMGSTYKVSIKNYRGTNGYFSPQVLLGKNNSEKDDMWSVGIVFLELIKKQTEIFRVKTNQNVKDIGRNLLEYILKTFYDISAHEGELNENINYNEIINFIDDGEFNEFNYRLKPALLKGINDEDKEIITKLLKLDPKERLTAHDLVNSDLFKKLDYIFIDSDFEYYENDFRNYLSQAPANLEEFKRRHKEIKEKFIGKTIFD